MCVSDRTGVLVGVLVRGRVALFTRLMYAHTYIRASLRAVKGMYSFGVLYIFASLIYIVLLSCTLYMGVEFLPPGPSPRSHSSLVLPLPNAAESQPNHESQLQDKLLTSFRDYDSLLKQRSNALRSQAHYELPCGAKEGESVFVYGRCACVYVRRRVRSCNNYVCVRVYESPTGDRKECYMSLSETVLSRIQDEESKRTQKAIAEYIRERAQFAESAMERWLLNGLAADIEEGKYKEKGIDWDEREDP